MLTPLSRLAAVMIMLMIFCSPSMAAKTDIVYLKNGDRITGEVKDLSRGKLKFSTDHMGTVYIEWEDIHELVSTTGQSVELTNGQRFYGPLSKPEANEEMLYIATEQGTVGVGTTDVVSMYPVESGFWNRLDITAGIGFSWDKGSSVGKYNISLDTEFRDPRFVTKGSFYTEVTTQENNDDTTRANLSLNHMVFQGNKRFVDYFGLMEHNDELGIDLRTLVGAGYGWVPIRSNNNWFTIAGGLDINHEIPSIGDSETNLEAVGMINYEFYKYTNPERKFTVGLRVFPSLTDFGRWRADFSTDFRLEFVDDLFWVLEAFANYDSDPVSIAASNSDYGTSTSLSYKF